MFGESINILIVDDEQEIRETIRKKLEQLGVPLSSIVECDTTDAALNIIINALDEARDEETESLMDNERKRIHMLISDIRIKSDEDGAFFIREISDGLKEDRPYIVGMSESDLSAETIQMVTKHADMFLDKGDTTFYEEKMQEAIKNAQDFVSLQVQDKIEELKEMGIDIDEVEKQQQCDDQQHVVIPEAPRIVSGDEALNIYEQLDDLPDLTKAESYPKGTPVALFDVDGTITDEFVMGRFVLSLLQESKYADRYSSLIEKLPIAQQKRNQSGFKNLINVIKADKEKGKWIKNERGDKTENYEEMLNFMNACYAQMLAGLPVREMCVIGAEWSREDAKEYLKRDYKFVKPVIVMLKHLGIVSTLVTGMPAETLLGYREALDIEDRCHFLEMEVEKNEHGILVYKNRIKHEGGSRDTKTSIARVIARNHDIYLVFGNRKSDLGMMSVAMSKKGPDENLSPFGKALYVIGETSSDRLRRVGEFAGDELSKYKRKHLDTLDKDFSRFCILEDIALKLFRMERWFQYVEGREEATKKFREKLHALVFHPHGQADGKGNPIEKRGGFKQFIPED